MFILKSYVHENGTGQGTIDSRENKQHILIFGHLFEIVFQNISEASPKHCMFLESILMLEIVENMSMWRHLLKRPL